LSFIRNLSNNELTLTHDTMVLEGDAKKLKIIVGEDDMIYKRPLFEAILFAAKKYKVAGATVHKGIMSFGADSIDNRSKVFTMSDEKPVIIEIVDREERITDFAEVIKDLLKKSCSGGIIYTENVNVILYSHADISLNSC